jgi:signal transduction histidine kinase
VNRRPRVRAIAGLPTVLLRRSVLVLVLICALGLTGTVLSALALRNADDERRERALVQQTELLSQVVSTELRRYGTMMTDLAAAVGAQARLEASEFTAITAAVDRQRLPGATGIAFVVPVPPAGTADAQAYWRDRGDPGLVLRPRVTGGEHRYIVFSRSIDGGPSSAGLDLAAAAEADAALTAARRTSRVTISRTYRLLKDATVAPHLQQLSFVLVAPVYATSPGAPDLGRFRGWLSIGLRGQDFLNEAIGAAARDTVAVTLADTGTTDPLPVARWQPRAAIDPDGTVKTVAVAVPQRIWHLTVRPTDRLLADRAVPPYVVAWLVGGVITALLAALTTTVLTSRDRALRRVDEATAALRDDITRREQVEHRLRQREAELVGFAGIVAHDLRGPLARVLGYADFLADEAADRLEPPHQEFLERLRGGAHRMQVLIDDLLDYATADNRPVTRADVDLHALANEVVREHAGSGAARPATIVVEPLPVVAGDPVLLRQVLDNLVGNAVKYTPAGAEPSVHLSGHVTDDGRLRVEVADRGIGIPDAERQTVFTAFHRATGSDRYPGTGLGLAIVHRIVERHGGHVGVRPNPGGGSVFWFTLPSGRAGDAARGPELVTAARR